MALGNSSHLVLQSHLCMRCLVTSNKIFSLTSQKGDSIASVDYLKVKNDVTITRRLSLTGAKSTLLQTFRSQIAGLQVTLQ